MYLTIFDWDADGKHDYTAAVSCEAGKLSPGARFPMTPQEKVKKTPELIVVDSKVVEIAAPGPICRATGLGIELTVSGLKLDKKDSGVGAKSDPCPR